MTECRTSSLPASVNSDVTFVSSLGHRRCGGRDLNAEPIAEARPLKVDPIAGADGPVYPEQFPYPSTVTGTVPLGAPVTVSWAAAGVAIRRRKPRPSTRMSRLSVSFDYLRCLTANDRNRSDSNHGLTSLALLPGSLCIKSRRDQYGGLLSVTSLFGRRSRRFKAIFRPSRSILHDDLDKTIVPCALGNLMALGQAR